MRGDAGTVSQGLGAEQLTRSWRDATGRPGSEASKSDCVHGALHLQHPGSTRPGGPRMGLPVALAVAEARRGEVRWSNGAQS